MASPQFDKKKSNHHWLNLIYQSNTTLNDKTHHAIKVMIAEILIKKCGIDVVNMHSYIHGNIIFSITSQNMITDFDKIIKAVEKPLASHTPQLLFNLSIVGIDTGTPRTHFMYINGDDELNLNFQKSIKHLIE